jgi:hypothetical protein
LNDSGGSAFADRYAARDTDNIWNWRCKFAKKGIRRLTQVLRRRNVKVKQPRTELDLPLR